MCDSVVIVRPDGVLFAKNSDRDANEAQILQWQPAQSHAPGSTLRCTYLEIPQVSRTHATLVSRPFWMWGAEMGTNEHGVTIGNEAVFTKEPLADVGLTGMDLVRLALERSATATAAVQVIVELLEQHGQGGGCGLENRNFSYHNSFMIADPHTAFVLETAGKKHAVEQVIEGPRTISNALSIPAFAERYSDTIKTQVAAGHARQCRTQTLARDVARVGDLMRLLRDHGTSGAVVPEYHWTNGGLGVPCVHGGGLVASSQTTGAWVADLRAGHIRHWVTATAAPCLSLFKPVAVDQPLDLGPPPTDRADPRSLWWRHERLHRRVMQDPARLASGIIAERDQVERRWLADPPPTELAFADGDRLLARWTAEAWKEPVEDQRPWYVRRFWQKRNAAAGLEA
ncbi:MAG: hypothetical protein K1X74_18385 [Pirellulales bacterium]|nr:hypothetical protein [Pirellulales bacterium]